MSNVIWGYIKDQYGNGLKNVTIMNHDIANIQRSYAPSVWEGVSILNEGFYAIANCIPQNNIVSITYRLSGYEEETREIEVTPWSIERMDVVLPYNGVTWSLPTVPLSNISLSSFYAKTLVIFPGGYNLGKFKGVIRKSVPGFGLFPVYTRIYWNSGSYTFPISSIDVQGVSSNLYVMFGIPLNTTYQCKTQVFGEEYKRANFPAMCPTDSGVDYSITLQPLVQIYDWMDVTGDGVINYSDIQVCRDAHVPTRIITDIRRRVLNVTPLGEYTPGGPDFYQFGL
jgi:hypothetical protein